MYNRHTHKVRIHGWENGELIVGLLTFTSEKEAYDFATEKSKTYGHLVKIYNEFNELVHEFASTVYKTTYA